MNRGNKGEIIAFQKPPRCPWAKYLSKYLSTNCTIRAAQWPNVEEWFHWQHQQQGNLCFYVYFCEQKSSGALLRGTLLNNCDREPLYPQSAVLLLITPSDSFFLSVPQATSVYNILWYIIYNFRSKQMYSLLCFHSRTYGWCPYICKYTNDASSVQCRDKNYEKICVFIFKIINLIVSNIGLAKTV